MKVFKHNGDWYTRALPTKRLFHSTTIWEIVNRGDIFAVRLRDGLLTVIPGETQVEQQEANVHYTTIEPTQYGTEKVNRVYVE